MCDDLRKQATLQLDRMLGATESLSDVERPEKRELVELGPSAQPSPKKAKTTNSTDIATMAVVKGLHETEPRNEPSCSEQSVDVFAPPLFVDNTQPSVDNFDPPMFLGDSFDPPMFLGDNFDSLMFLGSNFDPPMFEDIPPTAQVHGKQTVKRASNRLLLPSCHHLSPWPRWKGLPNTLSVQAPRLLLVARIRMRHLTWRISL